MIWKIKEAYTAFLIFTGTWLENDKYIFISSKDTGSQFGVPLYSLIKKKNLETVSNHRTMIEHKKYFLEIPAFEYLDEVNDEFISIINGKDLTSALFEGSPMAQNVLCNQNILYLVKVKLK